jgi:hypothetical protein
MRAVNPPPNPAEVVRSQARYQLERLNRTYNDLWPHGPRNEGSDLGILEAFTLRHPMTAATKEQAAIHEAGHSIAYERLGMMMNAAEITGPRFGRGGWGGTAQYCELFYGPWRGEWYPDAMQRGAIATLAGPIAEELIGRGEALSSLGEVVAAIVLVRRAAELEGRKPSEFLHEVFLGTSRLVARHEPEIRDIGALLIKGGRIHRSQPSVRKILSRVPRAAIDTEPLSVSGQTLFDKLMGAFEELRLLASSARAAARGELSEAGL